MDQIITMRLDSDDMYHPKAGQYIMEDDSGSAWYYFKEGYGFRFSTKHMWRYATVGVGPFFAHRYLNTKDFAKKAMVIEPPHTEIAKHNPNTEIAKHNPKATPENMFLVGITGQNTTTNIKQHCFRQKIYKPEKDMILQDFNLVEYL